MSAPANAGAGQPRASGKGIATRAALLELAADLFAERGYAQTSIRDIARRGALTTGAVYGHFRSKADLLVEAINVRTSEELEAQTMGLDEPLDYVATLTRLAREFPKRRRLRALIVQGAAASQTDDETRRRLRDEQRSHLRSWIDGYERNRRRMRIDPSVDIPSAVLYTWAVELGLGVLEGVGIEPRSKKGWSDIHNRMARGLQLRPDNAGTQGGRARRQTERL